MPTAASSELREIQQFAAIFELLGDGIAIFSAKTCKLLFANQALIKITGLGETQLAESLEECVKLSGGSDGEIEIVCETERGRVALQAATFHLYDRSLVAIIARRQPSPCESPFERERRDPLTGLHDRTYLLERVAELLRGERAMDQRFAVLFIDLDTFKQVNDEHGHLVGDRVLSEVARRLAECIRSGDCIVRFGGDEFVALLTGVTASDEIDPVVERIHMTLARPIAIEGDGEVTLSVSVGVAEASPEHHTAEDLIREADRAMYAAKRLQARR